MNIGIIAEGNADLAVIENILATRGIDSSQIIALRPELRVDEYDRNNPNIQNERTFGSWTNVMKDCKDKERAVFEKFFFIETNKHIIIQLDTAETDKYEVSRPLNNKKDETYFTQLRQNVINKISEWLENNYQEQLIYAIAIEEIDAWVLTIYTNGRTDNITDPKSKLRYILTNEFGIKKNKKTPMFDYYYTLTEPFSWKKSKKGKNNINDAALLNYSLLEFINDIDKIIA